MRQLVIVSGLVILSAALFAQGAGGTLTGVVTGPTGAPVSDAPIQAKNRQNGAVVRAATAADGRYRLAPIPPGSYDISIIMPCCAYEPFVQPDVAIANEDRYPEQPALLPWAAAELQKRLANAMKDAPHTRCLPQGLPTPASIGPFMAKMVQTPSLLVVLFEDAGGFRQIFMDGRPHPQDPDPSWVGHSIGKWDGDTLIIDTIGYNDQSWIGIYPHSEMLHVTERIRRPDFGHLDIAVTFDDPGAFSAPYHQMMTWDLLPAEEVIAYVCENNKAEHLVGTGK
jgi:hypothetical protein